MQGDVADRIFSQGLTLLRNNHLREASDAFRRAWTEDSQNPLYLSYYGLSVALAEKNFPDGITFCRAAIQRAPYQPELYLNLCKIYTIARQRKNAIQTLQAGLGFDKSNALLQREWRRMGLRRKAALSLLSRDHPLNKAIGQFTYKLGKVLSSHK